MGYSVGRTEVAVWYTTLVMNEQMYEKELKSVQRQINRVEEKSSLLKIERDLLIKESYEKSNMTMQSIATSLGITKGLVWQIVRGYRKNTNES